MFLASSPMQAWKGEALMSNPDAVGPDGTVRLRCYLPLADTHWFSAGDTSRHLLPVTVGLSRLSAGGLQPGLG